MKRAAIKVFLAASILLLLVLAAGAALADGAPTISQQPESLETVTGRIVTLRVAAKGSGLKYQWYRRYGENDTWKPWNGKTRSALRFYSTSAMDGMQVRCVVSNAGGKARSNAADILILPKFTSYSVNAEGYVGEKVKVSVSATGKDLKYQWYYRKSYDGDWIAWKNATSESYEFVLSEKYRGCAFQCVVTAGNGRSISTWDYRELFATFSIIVKNPTDIKTGQDETLYYLNEVDLDKLTIPKGLPQSLDMSGHKVEISSGSNLEVDNGVVRPAKTKWYYHQLESGYWVGSTGPSGQEGEIVLEEFKSGDSVITIDGSTKVTVHVKNYATVYAENVMDNYISANIADGLTEYQKAELCCGFVAGYGYSIERSGYTGLIVHGSGDCWASNGALQYMLQKLGITCKSRYAGYDDGAGSGHYNVFANLDGRNYIVDAGFNGTAPRHYSITLSESSFSYQRISQDSIAITKIANIEGKTEIKIPEKIDGYTVTQIGRGALSLNHTVRRIHLPDTVTSIGEEAFYEDYALESVNIPEGVTSIGKSAFAWCTSLSSMSIPASVSDIGIGNTFYCSKLPAINVDPGNKTYCSVDGVVYSKDMSTLILMPPGRTGSYQVPDGVTTIANHAFTTVSKLTELILPTSLRMIEHGAFWYGGINELVLPEGLEIVSDKAFYKCFLPMIELPDSLKRIEESAFASCDVDYVELPPHLEYIGPFAFAGNISLNDITIPASVKEIGEGAFSLDNGWSSMGASEGAPTRGETLISFQKGSAPKIGEKAFTNVTLGVFEGSTVHKYAQDNNVFFVLLDADGKVPIDASWFHVKENPDFTGQPLEPRITVAKASPVEDMHEGSDYVVHYSDNILPGTGTVTVEGINQYSGSATLDFSIFEHDLNDDHMYTVDDVILGLLGREPKSVIQLPADTVSVGAEAFAGVPVEVVYVPASVKKIANNAFDADVILVLENDSLVDWAKSRGYRYAVQK